MAINPPIDAVKATFDYRPETGELIWKKARSHRVGKEAGTIAPTGYRTITWRGRNWPAHRLIWVLFYGRFPVGAIDHINGDRADNRISNLRDVRPQENNRNCAIGKANTSGVLGVSWHRRRGKWAARIRVNYQRINLGYFDDLDRAREARKAAERKYGFHPNHGREARAHSVASAHAPTQGEERELR